MTDSEIWRAFLAALALYVLALGTYRLRAAWQTVPTETRLLWLVCVTSGAAALFANVVGLVFGLRITPGAYASAIPLILGAAVVTMPKRYRL